ncbi:hypothetical protein D3C78_1441820 [compost metagenome]
MQLLFDLCQGLLQGEEVLVGFKLWVGFCQRKNAAQSTRKLFFTLGNLRGVANQVSALARECFKQLFLMQSVALYQG